MDTDLQKAIIDGDEDVVISILTTRLIHPDFSMFEKAYEHKQFNVARVLFDNLKSYVYEPISKWLMTAAFYGDLDTVRFIIEKVPNIDGITKGNALFDASRAGHIAIVKYLITQKADITLSNYISIKQAAESGHDEVVKFLLFMIPKSTTDTRIKTETNDMYDVVLSIAARHGNLELFEYLYRSHRYSAEILHFVLVEAAVAGKRNILDFLLSKDIRKNVLFEPIPKTSWDKILNARHFEIIKTLVAHGYELHLSDERFFIEVAKKGDYNGLKNLFDTGALDQGKHAEMMKDTALQQAVEYGHIEMVQLLLDNNAHATKGVHAAVVAQEASILDLLLSVGPITQEDLDQALVREAGSGPVLDVVKKLVDAGANVNTRMGYVLRMVVGLSRNYEIAKFLLDRGADAQINENPALRAALFYENMDMVELLIQYGARPESVSFFQVMQGTIARKKWKSVNYLVDLGVHLKKAAYKTAFRYGLQEGQYTLINKLVAQKVIISEIMDVVEDINNGDDNLESLEKILLRKTTVPLRVESIIVDLFMDETVPPDSPAFNFLVEYLIKTRGYDPSDPFFEAAREGNFDQLHSLLQNVPIGKMEIGTVLAFQHGHVSLYEFLYQKTAKLTMA